MIKQVLEGTWEEIAQHADELSGKRVRLTVLEESLSERAQQTALAGQPLPELLEGLLGAINSREPFAAPQRERDAFGDAVVAKLEKQGIRLP